MRRYLRKFEVDEFVRSYVYKHPFNVEKALQNARPDLDKKKGQLVKMGESILQNPTVTNMICTEFQQILKDSGIDNAKKKYLDVLLEAEKQAKKKSNSKDLIDIAKMWGQMSGEFGLKQTVTETKEVSGKLTEGTIKQLEDQRIKITQKITTESEE